MLKNQKIFRGFVIYLEIHQLFGRQETSGRASFVLHRKRSRTVHSNHTGGALGTAIINTPRLQAY